MSGESGEPQLPRASLDYQAWRDTHFRDLKADELLAKLRQIEAEQKTGEGEPSGMNDDSRC